MYIILTAHYFLPSRSNASIHEPVSAFGSSFLYQRLISDFLFEKLFVFIELSFLAIFFIPQILAIRFRNNWAQKDNQYLTEIYGMQKPIFKVVDVKSAVRSHLMLTLTTVNSRNQDILLLNNYFRLVFAVNDVYVHRI